MSRANPFGDLDDFTPQGNPKPVAAAAIDEIAQASGFPSRKARLEAPSQASAPAPVQHEKAETTVPARTSARTPRRHTTGRNQQINIKATEATIETLYRIADELNLPLGAVLEQALDALDQALSAQSDNRIP